MVLAQANTGQRRSGFLLMAQTPRGSTTTAQPGLPSAPPRPHRPPPLGASWIPGALRPSQALMASHGD